MAKKDEINLDIFSKTEGQEDKDPITPRGVGLKASEWEYMQEIADQMGSTPHALAVWAIRDFIKRYDAGEIETETRPRLPGL